jgi:hypothetical protein
VLIVKKKKQKVADKQIDHILLYYSVITFAKYYVLKSAFLFPGNPRNDHVIVDPDSGAATVRLSHFWMLPCMIVVLATTR